MWGKGGQSVRPGALPQPCWVQAATQTTLRSRSRIITIPHQSSSHSLLRSVLTFAPAITDVGDAERPAHPTARGGRLPRAEAQAAASANKGAAAGGAGSVISMGGACRDGQGAWKACEGETWQGGGGRSGIAGGARGGRAAAVGLEAALRITRGRWSCTHPARRPGPARGSSGRASWCRQQGRLVVLGGGWLGRWQEQTAGACRSLCACNHAGVYVNMALELLDGQEGRA